MKLPLVYSARTALSRGLRTLLLVAFVFLLLGDKAYAVNPGCRSDPTVLLSNGTTLDLSADIAVPIWNVQRVDYTLHIPAGLAVVATVFTPSWPTTIEHLTVYADNPPSRYSTDTLVQTKSHGVAVSANLILLSPLSLVLAADSAGGYDGQPIYMSFQH